MKTVDDLFWLVLTFGLIGCFLLGVIATCCFYALRPMLEIAAAQPREKRHLKAVE